MKYKAVYHGIINVEGRAEPYETSHLAADLEHALWCLVQELADRSNRSKPGRLYEKLLATGTLTITLDPLRQDDPVDRLKKRAQKAAERAATDGIVEIVPEGE